MYNVFKTKFNAEIIEKGSINRVIFSHVKYSLKTEKKVFVFKLAIMLSSN